MFRISRIQAVRRTESLLQRAHQIFYFSKEDLAHKNYQPRKRKGLSLLIYQAGLDISPALVISGSLILGLAAGVLVLPYLHPLANLIVLLFAGAFPIIWLDRRVSARACEFAEEYPSVLLGTASSMKVGYTAFLALERSVRLLPSASIVRKEVEELLKDLRQGEAPRIAVEKFADSIRQADIELFRNAFVLVLENGGRFAPTLERLAQVSRDRSKLIGSARVSTANMRMTANTLLLFAPIILLMTSTRSENFWEIFFHHPTANALASTGMIVIGIGYLVLQKMSDFKP